MSCALEALQNPAKVYQDSWPPNGNSKFEILPIKIFSIKQKVKQIFSASKKNQTLSLQKTVLTAREFVVFLKISLLFNSFYCIFCL